MDLESERLSLIKEGNCVTCQSEESTRGSDDSCDILCSLCLVPKFNEKGVKTFFLFECLADARGRVELDYGVHSFAAVCVDWAHSRGFFVITTSESSNYEKVTTSGLEFGKRRINHVLTLS